MYTCIFLALLDVHIEVYTHGPYMHAHMCVHVHVHVSLHVCLNAYHPQKLVFICVDLLADVKCNRAVYMYMYMYVYV